MCLHTLMVPNGHVPSLDILDTCYITAHWVCQQAEFPSGAFQLKPKPTIILSKSSFFPFAGKYFQILQAWYPEPET